MNYNNPRMKAEFHDWPSGSHRVSCVFEIEKHPSRGERAFRQTQHPTKKVWSAPKALTYAVKQRIVDGDDGKTYILCLSIYGSLYVMQSNMQFQQESIDMRDERYPQLRNLFND